MYHTNTDEKIKYLMVMVMRMMNGDSSGDEELCEERRSRILEGL